jgi:hypothetical protein
MTFPPDGQDRAAALADSALAAVRSAGGVVTPKEEAAIYRIILVCLVRGELPLLVLSNDGAAALESAWGTKP